MITFLCKEYISSNILTILPQPTIPFFHNISLTCNPAVVLLDIDPRIESSNYNKTSTQILIVVLFLISQHWYRPTCSTGWVVNPCSVGCYSARNRNTLLIHAAVWPNYILLHEHRYTQWSSCDICETGWSMSPFIVERKGIIARI